MASRRRSVLAVNYRELNNLSTEILFGTGKKPKGKLFAVDRIITRRKVQHVSYFLKVSDTVLINIHDE